MSLGEKLKNYFYTGACDFRKEGTDEGISSIRRTDEKGLSEILLMKSYYQLIWIKWQWEVSF